MSKFKVGDEVSLVSGARSIVNNVGDGNIYVIEDIKSDGVKLKGLFPYYHYSLFETVKTLEGNIMNKFKVGDKVVRTGLSVGKALQGSVYEISEVFPLISDRLGINLEGHEPDENTRFQYYSSGFELYVEDCLTPSQAASAILKEEKLQIYDTDCDKWYTFSSGHRNITIEDLKHIKLRLKPKTILINGVEVPAPLGTLSGRKSAFYINLFRKVLVETLMPYDIKDELMWATKEDAQKVLDAMLIPFNEFNELNKGER